MQISFGLHLMSGGGGQQYFYDLQGDNNTQSFKQVNVN